MADIELRYRSMPSILVTYPQSFVGRKPALIPEGKTVPAMEASIEQVRADATRVTKYNRVCGFTDSDNLPITYPHILAMPLQLHLIVNKAFPVRAMGLVHIGNTIRRYAQIPNDESLSIRCYLEGHQETDKGQEFDMRTEVSSAGSVLWEESSIYLARRRSSAKRKGYKPASDPQQSFDEAGTVSSGWNAPAGIGRQYARVSGDFNPIHLSKPTAKLLGFPTAIGHGMWSLARTLADIGEDKLGTRVRVDASFKLPILLPAWVTLLSRSDKQGTEFLLSDGDGKKPHLSGHCSPL